MTEPSSSTTILRRFIGSNSTELCDVRTGVICSPNNYLYGDSELEDKLLPDGVIRITSIANYDLWKALPDEQLRTRKTTLV